MVENGLAVLGLVFVVIIILSAPLFWQLWKITKNLSAAVDTLNRSLPGILKDTEEIASNINTATALLKREAEDLSKIGRKIQRIVALEENIEQILQVGTRRSLVAAVKTTRGLLRGLKVFYNVLQEDKSSNR